MLHIYWSLMTFLFPQKWKWQQMSSHCKSSSASRCLGAQPGQGACVEPWVSLITDPWPLACLLLRARKGHFHPLGWGVRCETAQFAAFWGKLICTRGRCSPSMPQTYSWLLPEGASQGFGQAQLTVGTRLWEECGWGRWGTVLPFQAPGGPPGHLASLPPALLGAQWPDAAPGIADEEEVSGAWSTGRKATLVPCIGMCWNGGMIETAPSPTFRLSVLAYTAVGFRKPHSFEYNVHLHYDKVGQLVLRYQTLQ